MHSPNSATTVTPPPAYTLPNALDWFGQGNGVLGSGIAFSDLKDGIGIAGGLFDTWTNFKNSKDLLNLRKRLGEANIGNINARTTTLQNRQSTLFANNANNIPKPITGSALAFGQPTVAPTAPQGQNRLPHNLTPFSQLGG